MPTRRGRGRRGGRQGARSSSRRHNDVTAVRELIDFNANPKQFLTDISVTADEHYDVQMTCAVRYMAAIKLLEEYEIGLPQSCRIRALAMSIARSDGEMMQAFLAKRESFGAPYEVVKAMQLLDSGRQVRVEEKKLRRLQLVGTGKVKPHTIGKIKSNIDNLNRRKPKHGSASGATCQKIKEWIRSFSKDELEFMALHFPTNYWKELADICHFNPKQDFPQLPWFLPFVFGGEAPPESIVHRCRHMTEDNVNELLKSYNIPFSHVRQLHESLTDESKLSILNSSPDLDTIIWNYEELSCPQIDEVITRRLKAGETIRLPYSKVMERLTVFYNKPEANPFIGDLMKIADESLDKIRLSLDSPVAVFGDASSSMDVAIRTATIISSLLCKVCSAKFSFFNTANIEPPFKPLDTADVLHLSTIVKASGATSPAACLYPYYLRKEAVKTFIIVTDEEENTPCKGYMFAPLYRKYCEEICPENKLVFVSFLRQNATGQMYSELEEEFKPLQFKFDSRRPDLSKLGDLFGQLASSVADGFNANLKLIEDKIRRDGFMKVFHEKNILLDKDITKSQ